MFSKGCVFLCCLVCAAQALSDTAVDILVGALAPFSDEKNIFERIASDENLEFYLEATPGEYESLAFYVASKSSVDSLMVEISDLSMGDNVVTQNNIDLKHVLYWYQAGGAWDSHRIDSKKKRQLVPELLSNDPQLVQVDHQQRNLVRADANKRVALEASVSRGRKSLGDIEIIDATSFQPINLRANIPAHMFLTILVPMDAAPGIYTGALSIRVGAAEKKETKFQLNVLPFALQSSPLKYGLYYRGKLNKKSERGISSEWKSENQMAVELLDMKKHGICCPTIYQRIFPKYSNESYDENVKNYKRHLELRSKSDINNREIFYLGLLAGGPTSLKNLDSFRHNVRRVIDISKEYGVEKVYFYGKEERKSHEYSQQKPAWDVVRQEGGGIFVALDDRYFEIEQDITPDIMVYHNKINQVISSRAHALGAKIYSYASPQVGVENPQAYRDRHGFLLLQNDFDGVLNYAYQDSMGRMWVDDDHQNYRDLAFSYPATAGVIETVAWQGFREAVDDTKYFQTYKYYYQSAGQDQRLGLESPEQVLAKDISPNEKRKLLIEYTLKLVEESIEGS